ncbi:ABC transporter substrate-binding protein [Galbitalea sp. SE-J8]|uniref:ABC transporter substrate-binding protein n=1 Tax=Galbitalea sp. SE-J8 TaxID=3054952 RepID=UPI00259D05BB|nr:ABC transporter substrate-binding protein [Galbitalea sp. SE-J8]MDM4761793.1 ABC transporter substrate-binding protein [Galbitalea sp. SE-J8]
MFTASRKTVAVGIVALGLAAGLSACSSSDPLSSGPSTDPGSSASAAPKEITIGAQFAGEGEILAQIYGQVLAANGYTVDYPTAPIGSRETFIPALKDGSIDLIPDYSGNLLYAEDPGATATSADDVAAALPAAVEKDGLAVLDTAPAEDADSLVVTPEFSEKNGVTSIGDLAKLDGDFTIGANTEFESRPYGRDGLESVYGVTGWTFKAIDDYGGPGTLKDLLDDNIQVADIYTTTPSVKANNLVTLADPEHLIAAQNIVPLLSKAFATPEIADLLNPVSAKLTTDGLLDLNAAYAGDDKPSAASLATTWLTDNGFLS